LCALALLLAQQAALTHQVWHALGGGVAHASDAAKSGERNPRAPQDPLCKLHGALGAVLGAFEGAAGAAELLTLAEGKLPVHRAPAARTSGLAPVSRGPPALL